MYEFRAFGQDLDATEGRINDLAKPEVPSEVSELYLLSAAHSDVNAKVKRGHLDIKRRMETRANFDHWKAVVKDVFPVPVKVLQMEVFPMLGVVIPDFRREEYTFEQFMDELVVPHPEIKVVNVIKQRRFYSFNHCSAEVSNVYVNGAFIKSISIESTDLEALLETRKQLDLSARENVSYTTVLKRLVGMELMPGFKY